MDQNPTIVDEIIYNCPVDHSGATIAVHGWKVQNSLYPPLIITHDIGEKIDRYFPLIEELNKIGISAYTFNFGLNYNRAGDQVPRFSTLTKELLQIVAWIKHSENGKSPVVLGRGMGALILLYLTNSQAKFFRGIVFSAPMFHLSQEIKPLKRFLIKTIADTTPNMKLPKWLSPTFTNSYQETYMSSPKKKTPRVQSSFALDLLTSIEQSRSLLLGNNIPTLFLCPTEDPSLKYEFLAPLIHSHPNPGLFVLKYITGEDNLPLEPGGTTLNYFLKSVKEWLDENIMPGATVAPKNKKPKTPTIIKEPVKSVQSDEEKQDDTKNGKESASKKSKSSNHKEAEETSHEQSTT